MELRCVYDAKSCCHTLYLHAETHMTSSAQEAFRRWGVFDRQLTDLIVERMSDEVDRFTTRDLVDALARSKIKARRVRNR